MGEPWVAEIPYLNEDGSTNSSFAIFLVTYVLVVNWTLLQVTVAVLLDK